MAGKPMTTPPLPDQPEGTVDAAMALHAGHLEATIAADGSDRVSDKPAGALENISIEIADIELLASEVQGERIGRYKLLQQIGEGGFGTVWMAEQMEPVTRRVEALERRVCAWALDGGNGGSSVSWRSAPASSMPKATRCMSIRIVCARRSWSCSWTTA